MTDKINLGENKPPFDPPLPPIGAEEIASEILEKGREGINFTMQNGSRVGVLRFIGFNEDNSQVIAERRLPNGKKQKGKVAVGNIVGMDFG